MRELGSLQARERERAGDVCVGDCGELEKARNLHVCPSACARLSRAADESLEKKNAATIFLARALLLSSLSVALQPHLSIR